MDNMTRIYRVDCTKGSWKCILEELGLPDDTDEICVKHVSHLTETQREQIKKDAWAHEE